MMEVSYLQKVLDYLADRHLIDQSVFRNLSSQRLVGDESVITFLRNNKVFVKPEELTQAISSASGYDYFNLIGIEIPRTVLEVIPLEVAKNYKVICFKKDTNEIYVGFVEPENLKAVDAIDFLSKEHDYGVNRYVISPDSFDNAFKQYRALASEVSQALLSAKEQLGLEGVDGEVADKGATLEEEGESSDQVLKRAPVSKIASVIIRHAVEGNASDVHIEPLATETRVRYRIDGVLHTSIILPRYVHAALVARIKVMARLKIDETRVPQDGRIRLAFEGKEVDFRVSTLPLVKEEKVVMRILRTSDKAPTLSDLGFLKRDVAAVEEIISNPTGGMLIVCGPTGSGKSTTLFSMLSVLNKEGVNIITIEDPVEYFVKGVNQSQVRPEVGFTFASGLRSFLRQDPDIIMVGEIRDEETAELAIHAGLTGHFVLSTLHTNDAIGAVPRLIDMGVEPFFVSSTLRLIMAQRLARKICVDCKTEIKLNDAIVKSVAVEFAAIDSEALKQDQVKFKPPFKFYHGKGCAKCGGTGYRGRLALTETIKVTKSLKEIIESGNKIEAMETEMKQQHFISMRQDGIVKALLGETTFAEILRVTSEGENIEEEAFMSLEKQA